MATHADAEIIYSGATDLTVTGTGNNGHSKTFKMDDIPVTEELSLLALQIPSHGTYRVNPAALAIGSGSPGFIFGLP